ncbi:MAG TPA: hypothetical protein VHA09_08845 [Nitrososphaera sp.]|nr:hypothetical protein [Nitrososphaera sp.]
MRKRGISEDKENGKEKEDKGGIEVEDWLERNLELENKLGDTMISEYQASRIRAGLVRKTEGYHHKAAGYYYRDDDILHSPSSTCEFKYKGKLFKLSIEVDELIPNTKSRLKEGLQKLARPFSKKSKTIGDGAEKEKL